MTKQDDKKIPKAEAKPKIFKKAKPDKQVEELTADLQRLRADFENYRKRVESEKDQCRQNGGDSMLLKVLPIIDNIDRAITHVPTELVDNNWVKGITAAKKSVDKSLSSLDVSKIDTTPGIEFNPELHEAIQFDEDSVGEMEVVESELQSGYLRGGKPLRHAMVRVTRK